MKNARFLTLIALLLLLIFWIYFNAIEKRVNLFDVKVICFHFIVFQYLAVLLAGFYYKKEIFMVNFLGTLIMLAAPILILVYIAVAFKEGIINALFAPIYIALIFCPLFFLFVPIHLFMIYTQYRRVSILSKHNCVVFYLLLGLLLLASTSYYDAFESIIKYSIPEPI